MSTIEQTGTGIDLFNTLGAALCELSKACLIFLASFVHGQSEMLKQTMCHGAVAFKGVAVISSCHIIDSKTACSFFIGPLALEEQNKKFSYRIDKELFCIVLILLEQRRTIHYNAVPTVSRREHEECKHWA